MADVIVAVDVASGEEAHRLMDELGEEVDFVKVGLELFTREGPAVVRSLRDRGLRVFLDLKLYDIPNTVEGAVEAAAELGVEFLTAHASGGRRMLEAAVRAAEGSSLRLLGVTLLTSLSAEEAGEIFGRSDVECGQEVRRLARLSLEAGVHGLVASPLEASSLRAMMGTGPALITPGIRLEGQEHADQVRVATPEGAVAAGADHLVLGRAVTGHVDPRSALRQVRARIAAALEEVAP